MTTATALKKRIDSIDILRGIIMIIMALDHVRDFFHKDAMLHDPTDPSTTTPVLFFTRFITHYCAPLFVFLAGTSVFLSGQRKTRNEQAVFLLKRGLWLVFVEIVIMNLLFTFDPLYHGIFLQVIWVTGVSMLCMAACIYLPLQAVFIIGIVMVAGHNLLDVFNETDPQKAAGIWYSLLHQQSFRPIGQQRFFGVFYPLIPWPGIMMLGYCLGSWFSSSYDAVKRRKNLVSWGLTAIVAFFMLRFINIYGDLFPWKEQKNTTATIISFFNVTKYPPSLLYCCITIGPGLLALAWLEKIQERKWTSFPVVFGRVPMFYYLLHFLLIHLLCVVAFFATKQPLSKMYGDSPFGFRPNDFGFSLGWVYLIWAFVIISLYPLCKRYSQYKATHTQWWLSYL
jgi:uncharacterized membrane protein